MKHTGIYTHPEIGDINVIFDDMEFQHLERVDHSNIYECRGYDEHGNVYSGIVEKTCDEYGVIEDIEFVHPHDFEQMKQRYNGEVTAGFHNGIQDADFGKERKHEA